MSDMTVVKSESGFTIIEVLIASVIFMIGFSMLVALLNNTLLKFSTEELLAGGNVGREAMLMAVSVADTTACDTIFENSGIKFRVVRQVAVRDGLAGVQITVYRQKNSKEILRLYDEFVLPQK